jgi:hypothetical protein
MHRLRTTARKNGRLVLNGMIEIRCAMGEKLGGIRQDDAR